MLAPAHASQPLHDAHHAVDYRNVLVPVDGPDGAAWALPTGRAIARDLDAELQIVAVARNTGEADRLRDELVSSFDVARHDPGLHVVVARSPAEAISNLASSLEPSLVCMPTYARGRIGGAIAGSVTRDLLAESGQPILAVGPRAEAPSSFGRRWSTPLVTRRIVACVDGTESSERVLPVAAAWATNLDMALTILDVQEPVPSDVGGAAGGEATAYVRRLAEEWRDRVSNVSGRVAYDPISQADGVKSYLERHPAGLVAVTTSLRSGWRRLLRGDAGMHVVRLSPAPVLLVPPAS